ncbi:MAG: hypothetical protein FWD31_05680 [Planctomycetaceae bacterium]|nr:hypothetical protein [Planctomycetaceae bacterium]
MYFSHGGTDATSATSKTQRHALASNHYERNTESSKAMIHIAMIARIMKLLENHDLTS